MIRGLLSLFSPAYLRTIVYMLQSTEYMAAPYLRWFWRTNNFSQVMRRRQLELTRPARLLLIALSIGVVLQICGGLYLIYLELARDLLPGIEFGIALILAYPVLWAHLIVIPLVLGRIFIIEPKEKALIKRSKQIFADHPAVKIAIAGSYGKTTMKELLATVLGEGKRIAMTPGNKNVAISHAAFAARLKGNEEVLIIEYGEGKPGDVKHFAETTQPTLAVITGIAPAHLDQYGSVEAVAQDIFSVAEYLKNDQVYVNADSVLVKPYLSDAHIKYNQNGCDHWKISEVVIGNDGMEFRLSKGKQTLKLKTGLLGRHQLGPLAVVAVIALKLGLTKEQVKRGIAQTAAYEHRMQPRQLHGALIIDDTYNGNLEGIRAGLALLVELPAQRKLYVTPGLVDQGDQTKAVHVEMGQLIAAAQPDHVILMQNSVTRFIEQGLRAGNYKGVIQLEEDPLVFYTNLEHFVAAGDVVLMQNDWTDNYA